MKIKAERASHATQRSINQLLGEKKHPFEK
jgi:hypothetical protein